MRRHELKRLGFHTGNPFIHTPSSTTTSYSYSNSSSPVHSGPSQRLHSFSSTSSNEPTDQGYDTSNATNSISTLTRVLSTASEAHIPLRALGRSSSSSSSSSSAIHQLNSSPMKKVALGSDTGASGMYARGPVSRIPSSRPGIPLRALTSSSSSLDAGRLAASRSHSNTYSRINNSELHVHGQKRDREPTDTNSNSNRPLDDSQAHMSSSLEDSKETPAAEPETRTSKRPRIQPPVHSIDEATSLPSTSLDTVHTRSSTAAAAAVSSPVAASVDVREKSRILLQESLQRSFDDASDPSSIPSAASFSHLSSRIESCLHHVCGDRSDTQYRRRVRSLVFNLKTNHSMVKRLIDQTMSPNELVNMDEAQLATDDVAAERQQQRQADFDASVFKGASRFASHEYRCPLCSSENCTTRVIREERDIAKADTWGSKQGAGSVIEIRCEECMQMWTKEE